MNQTWKEVCNCKNPLFSCYVAAQSLRAEISLYFKSNFCKKKSYALSSCLIHVTNPYDISKYIDTNLIILILVLSRWIVDIVRNNQISTG